MIASFSGRMAQKTRAPKAFKTCGDYESSGTGGVSDAISSVSQRMMTSCTKSTWRAVKTFPALMPCTFSRQARQQVAENTRIVAEHERHVRAERKSLEERFENLPVSEVIDIITANPRILKSPILIDEKRLQVGYKEDDIRAFLPRAVRNVENAQARMRAAL